MSYAVDANILVHASDQDSPLHTAALQFLQRCARGREVARPASPRGNLVPDAHLAALLQHGVGTLYTRDRDYLRFDFLELVHPLDHGVRDRRGPRARRHVTRRRSVAPAIS